MMGYREPKKYDAREIYDACEYGACEDDDLDVDSMEFVALKDYVKLKNAVLSTLEENIHLCDGDSCPLKMLKDAVGFDENKRQARGGLRFNALVSQYKRLGWEEEHHFSGEYVLLTNSRMDKVRVYENGDVWRSNQQSGEYIKTQANEKVSGL